MWKLLAVLLTFLPYICKSDSDWYKSAILYQIYPRSLRDNNNDGIGDLRGIIEKMDHFVDMGITAFWLSPIFKSPQVDQGYDISDYYDIDPDYGTKDDLKELIEKAHEANIKVLLDFVPNHSSDKHEWFNKSVAGVEGYEDFYIWKDAKKDANGNNVPPNNWISIFGGSAWEWNDQRQQYYLHTFAVQQPDLNYRSESLAKAMKAVLKYWLDFGVNGFRVDAVPYLVEDSRFLDEPVLNTTGCTDAVYDCLDHIYTKDQQGTFDVIYDWRDFIDDYSNTNGGDPRIFCTEAYTDHETTLRYYGSNDGSRLGAHFTFNFDFISYLTATSTPADLKNITDWWAVNLKQEWVKNWVLGNHDQHRMATRLKHPDAYNMLVVGVLPGVAVTYQGDEIGMEDGEVTCAQGKDPSAIKNCTTFPQISRDFERTPFHWDNSTNAGFNDGAEPWLPVSKKYLVNNLAAQNISGIRSHYNVYKASVKIRKQLDEWERKTNSTQLYSSQIWGNVFLLSRTVGDACPDMITYIYVFNMGSDSSAKVPISKLSRHDLTMVLVDTTSRYNVNSVVSADAQLRLGPGESVILAEECVL